MPLNLVPPRRRFEFNPLQNSSLQGLQVEETPTGYTVISAPADCPYGIGHTWTNEQWGERHMPSDRWTLLPPIEPRVEKFPLSALL